MDDSWEVLKEAGLPDGAARRRPEELPADDQIQAALEAIAKQVGTLDIGGRELLLAWLEAGLHHWPHRFAHVIGQAGPECLDRLERMEKPKIDRNRYLKLRRIAVENLSASL